jgi:hypothetical protein
MAFERRLRGWGDATMVVEGSVSLLRYITFEASFHEDTIIVSEFQHIIHLAVFLRVTRSRYSELYEFEHVPPLLKLSVNELHS